MAKKRWQMERPESRAVSKALARPSFVSRSRAAIVSATALNSTSSRIARRSAASVTPRREAGKGGKGGKGGGGKGKGEESTAQPGSLKGVVWWADATHMKLGTFVYDTTAIAGDATGARVTRNSIPLQISWYAFLFLLWDACMSCMHVMLVSPARRRIGLDSTGRLPPLTLFALEDNQLSSLEPTVLVFVPQRRGASARRRGDYPQQYILSHLSQYVIYWPSHTFSPLTSSHRETRTVRPRTPPPRL